MESTKKITKRKQSRNRKLAYKGDSKEQKPKNRHGLTSKDHQDQSSSTPKKPGIPFSKMVQYPIKHKNVARKLLMAAFEYPNKEDVLEMLHSNPDRITEILDAEYKANARPRDSSFSFQHVWMPFICLLCSLKTSPRNMEFRNIVERIYTHNTFLWSYGKTSLQYLSCKVLHQQTPKYSTDNVFEISCFDEYLLPIIELLKWMLSYIKDSACDEKMRNVVEDIRSLHQANTDSPADVRDQVEELLRHCIQTMDRINATNHNETIQKKKKPLNKRKQYRVIEESDLPGELRGEPRHDNDFENFRDISIIPTDEELLCPIEPYLPGDNDISDYQIPCPIERHLDQQFRLLREESLRAYRKTIFHFLVEGGVNKLQPNQKTMRCKHEEGSSIVHIIHHVTLVEPTLSEHEHELEFKFSFLQQAPGTFPPQFLVKKDERKKKLKEYWKTGPGSKVLQRGALVTLVATFGSDKERSIIVGVVSSPVDLREMLKTPMLCEVGIIPFQTTTATKKLLFDGMHDDALLLEVHGHFFTTPRVILSTLQSHTSATIPFPEHLGLVECNDANILDKAPAYLCNRQLDFSCIMKSPQRTFHLDQLRDTFEQTLQEIKAREEFITLDSTQINAFVAGLSRRVALIQGPPGTGKSYVGVQLVRFLLQNLSQPIPVPNAPMGFRTVQSKQYLPILCICYTNHALDQFLMDLIHSGISKKNVIRIGSRSKEEQLEKCNLHNKQFSKATPHSRYVYATSRRKAQESTFELENVLSNLQRISFEEVADFLELTEYETSDALLSPFDMDDYFTDDKTLEEILSIWLGKKENKHFPKGTKLRKDAEPFLRLFPWNLSKKGREKQFNDWNIEAKKLSMMGNIKRVTQSHADCVYQLKKLRVAQQVSVTKTAQVIGITTSGCGSYHELIKSIAPKIIICEEAGEVLESHVLASLTAECEHLILIGDHQQLRPKINEHFLTHDTNRGFSFDISLFERLVRKYEATNPQEIESTGRLVTLQTQRRMRPVISSLIRDTLYPNLVDHPSVETYPEVIGMASSLWFYDHSYPETVNATVSSSHSNIKEAEFAVQLARYFLRQGYCGEGEITILTPYIGQLLVLRDLMSKERMTIFISDKDMEDIENIDDTIQLRESQACNTSIRRQVKLSTIDNFQGEEANIIILSLVRCNSQGNIGFLKKSNRTNVMLSRARHGMYILGSTKTIQKKAKKSMLGKVVSKLQKEELLGDYIPLRCKRHEIINQVKTLEEFKLLCLDGGCNQNCDFRLTCGHACTRKCHPDDLEHKHAVCLEPCTRIIDPCGHPCQKKCRDSCDCMINIDVTLPCGHSQTRKCIRVHIPNQCNIMLTKTNPYCTHNLTMTCNNWEKYSESPTSATTISLVKCTNPCGEILPCGHPCKTDCYKCGHSKYPKEFATIAPCQQKLQHVMTCGHLCTGKCGHSQTECPPCEKKCSTKCSHSRCALKCFESCAICAERCEWICTCSDDSVTCNGFCGTPCTKLPCNNRCKKKMKCGHPCTSICGEKCPEPTFACGKCVSKKYSSRSICVLNLDLSVGSKEWDPDEEPIIQLPCNHVVTVDTLDGIFNMNTVYNMNQRTGEWTSTKEIHAQEIISNVKPTCPYCQATITNVFRYGRVLNVLAENSIKKKYLQECVRWCTVWAKVWQSCQTTQHKINLLIKFEKKRQELQQKDPTRSVWEKLQRKHATTDTKGVRFVQPLTILQSQLLKFYVDIGNEIRYSHWEVITQGIDLAFTLCQMTKEDNLKQSFLQAVEQLKCLLCLCSTEQLRNYEPQIGSLSCEGLLEYVRRRSEKEERIMVILVMQKDVGSGIGSFGGHWYTCPNGHIYTIGECGGAFETSSCPECGEVIGGTQHHVIERNAPAAEFLREHGFQDLVPTARHML